MVNASSHAARTPRFGVGSSAHEAPSSRGGEPSDSRAPFPDDCCIHELFGAQVSRTPEASALVFGDQELSYRQLDERSSQLAHHLQRLGVGPDVLVGLCVERSLDAIVALLGILKAGGAYVPLDPVYPERRLAFLLSDAAASVLVTQALSGSRASIAAWFTASSAMWRYVVHLPPATVSRPERAMWIV